MRVVHLIEILRTDNRDFQDAHRTLDKVAMLTLSLSQLLLGLLKPGIVCQDVLFNFLLSFNQLVLGGDVLFCELGNVDSSVCILIELVEELVHDLRSVFVINALL